MTIVTHSVGRVARRSLAIRLCRSLGLNGSWTSSAVAGGRCSQSPRGLAVRCSSSAAGIRHRRREQKGQRGSRNQQEARKTSFNCEEGEDRSVRLSGGRLSKGLAVCLLTRIRFTRSRLQLKEVNTAGKQTSIASEYIIIHSVHSCNG